MNGAVFGPEGPLEWVRAQRLGHPRRQSADPWLLEAEGRVVSALLAYPLTFGTPSGARVGAIGLGAVATLPDARGHGLAASLCRAVAEHYAQDGRPAGLLFSAIPPALYERLDYRVCNAHDFVCERLAPTCHWPNRPPPCPRMTCPPSTS